jgi:hypothetical protein
VTDDERERYINEVVAKGPPLTSQQIARLTALFDAPDSARRDVVGSCGPHGRHGDEDVHPARI